MQNFRTLCEWIGSAISNAQRLERTRRASSGPAASRIAPSTMLAPLTALLQDMVVRTRIDVTMVHLELIANNPSRDPQVHAALAAAVDQTVQRACDPNQICVATEAMGSYVMLWPYVAHDTARGAALHFVSALRQTLEERGLHAMVRHRVGPLVDQRKAA